MVSGSNFHFLSKQKWFNSLFFSNSGSLALVHFLWRTQNTFSMTTHTFLHPVTYRMFGSTGPGVNKCAECRSYVTALCPHPVWACCKVICMCVCVHVFMRERFVFLPLSFPHKVATSCKIQAPTPVYSHFPAHFTLCIAGKLGDGH